jgi:hypothetical protein
MLNIFKWHTRQQLKKFEKPAIICISLKEGILKDATTTRQTFPFIENVDLIKARMIVMYLSTHNLDV